MKNFTDRKDFDEDEGRQKRVEKGRNKNNKYKKKLYNMATSLKPDDEAFDEYLDYEDVSNKRFKLR